MTREEAAKYADNMTYRDAINNLMKAKSIPYRKATFIKVNELLKALEQEPCEDAISRQAVQDYIAKYLSKYLYPNAREAFEIIDEYIGELPPVNPQEPKTGRWIKISPADIYECSECGQNVMTADICAYRYCHGCGAKMAESEDK